MYDSSRDERPDFTRTRCSRAFRESVRLKERLRREATARSHSSTCPPVATETAAAHQRSARFFFDFGSHNGHSSTLRDEPRLTTLPYGQSK